MKGIVRGFLSLRRFTISPLRLSRSDAIENKLALTPTLSPKERETISSTNGQPRIGDPFERRQVRLPLLGERDGVRANVI